MWNQHLLKGFRRDVTMFPCTEQDAELQWGWSLPAFQRAFMHAWCARVYLRVHAVGHSKWVICTGGGCDLGNLSCFFLHKSADAVLCLGNGGLGWGRNPELTDMAKALVTESEIVRLSLQEVWGDLNQFILPENRGKDLIRDLNLGHRFKSNSNQNHCVPDVWYLGFKMGLNDTNQWERGQMMVLPGGERRYSNLSG